MSRMPKDVQKNAMIIGKNSWIWHIAELEERKP